MKKGFTLLELLIVIGIIGILVGVMLGTMTGASDSARAAKCLAHLHTLASACHSYAAEDGHYPNAGSWEVKDRISARESHYFESQGWISWSSRDAYPFVKTSSGWTRYATAAKAKSGWFMSTYAKDVEQRTHSLTNGTIWKAMSGNAANYQCPLHAKYARKNGVEPVWSYVMNGYFGYDESQGSKQKRTDHAASKWFTTLPKPDRRLLFAELPFNTDNAAQTCKFTTGTGIELDPTLQYEKNEVIGFNHKDGKKWYAHVCFADGHTEKLEMPKNTSTTMLRRLTEYLCEAKDFSFDGKTYQELE